MCPQIQPSQRKPLRQGVEENDVKEEPNVLTADDDVASRRCEGQVDAVMA